MMKMVWLIKAKKSPEGTLKKYPSGLIYKKQGEKWVYVAKVGTKKANDLIEEAKKQGIPVLEPTGRKTSQPSATPSQPPSNQPQPKQAKQTTQATASAPTKQTAADSGKWSPRQAKLGGPQHATKEQFETALTKMYNSLDIGWIETLLTTQGVDIGLLGHLDTYGNLEKIIGDPAKLTAVTDAMSKYKYANDIANRVAYTGLMNFIRAYQAFQETFVDPTSTIRPTMVQAGKNGIQVLFSSPSAHDLPYLTMDWGDLDYFAAAYKGSYAGRLARKLKSSTEYKQWQTSGGDPEITKLAGQFKNDFGLEISAGPTLSTKKTLLMKPEYLKGLHKLFKGLQAEFDMRKYTPPDGKTMKVRLAGASRGYVGFYVERDNTINISPSYTGVVLHEMGHYFWYRNQTMQDEFKQWVASSGLAAKIKKALYDPADISPDELKAHIHATFDHQLRGHTELLSKMTEYKDAVAKVAQTSGSDVRTIQSAAQYAEHLFWGIYREKMVENGGKIPDEAIKNPQFLTQGIVEADDAKLALVAAKIHADHPNLTVGTAEHQTQHSLMIWRDVLKNTDKYWQRRLYDGDLSETLAYANRTRLETKKLWSVSGYRRKRSYWSNPNEIFARSFRTYIAWKGGQKEGRSEGNMSKKERDSDPFGWGFPEVDPAYDMMPSLEPILKKYLGGMLLKRLTRKLAWILKKAKSDAEKEEEEEEAAKNKPTMADVKKFLEEHPEPEDYELHKWAESKGFNVHAVEELAYKLAASALKSVKIVFRSLLEKARAMRGTGAERPGHKYIKRWWENNQWNYLYPGDEVQGGTPPPEEKKEEKPKKAEPEVKDTAKAEEEPTHEVRTESGVVAQFGDRDRELARTQPQQTPLDAAQPYTQYGVQLARAEKTQRPRANHISEDIGKHLRPYQSDFVNLALEQFQAGQKSVVNTDGTGAGKTRQMMALANEYMLTNPNAKILITTDSDRVIDNAFASDGKTMGVPFTKVAKGDEFGKGGPGIYIAPYTRLEKLKANFDDVDFAIFDESHNLKNFGRAKTDNGVAIIKSAANCAFFSATPVDKAEHIHYLCAGLNLNYFDTMKYLGYTLAKVGTGSQWQTNLSAKIVADRINSIFEGLTEKGLMVKREVSLDNLDIAIKNVNLSGGQEARFYAALNDFENRLLGLKGLAFGRAKATGLMALRRLAEEMKTQQTVDMVKEKLKEGKQVCLFATRVNETEIKGDTNQYSPGTLLAVGEILKKEGVEFSSVFDSNPESEKEIEKFQSGKTKVILTTPESGGTGLNLDDRVGNAPRCAIVMTPPFSPIHFLQMIGRINRMTTKSKAEAVMLTIQNGPAQRIDDWNKNIIANKLVTLGAAVKGDYDKIDLEDLERVQYMNEKDAKEYIAQKKQKATVGVGSNSKFDPVVHQIVGTKADLKAKKRKDIIANAPPVTKFDKMSITKAGDKFNVQFDYDQNIVTAIQALPQKDRFFVKHTRTWIVDAQHYDALTEIGKKHATLPDAVKQQIAQKTQGAPTRMSVGHFQATRVGDKYNVTFNYDPNLVARVKAIQGRSFDPNTKVWTVPASEWKQLEQMSKDIMKVGATAMQAPQIKETARSDALKALQMLAQVCDGARKQDQMGFSGYDVKIGHDLASRDRLTDGMFRLAQQLVRKYKRQIPQDILDNVLADFDVQQKFYHQNRPAKKSREEVKMVLLLKGKDYPEGTIRAWRGGKFKKQNGIWFRLHEGKTKEEHAKDADAAKTVGAYKTFLTEMKEKYGKTPPHDGMLDEEKKKYEKLKLSVYKFHPEGKIPSDRKVEGSHEMRVALADVARRKIYLDDLQEDRKKTFNILVKEGLITWRHVAADEYVADLTDSGKKAVEVHAAHRKRAQREEEKKAAKKMK